ncbi:MAG TPA: SDR family oxidoreductase [Microbacterium sp.]|nr:SDR family oxidoreductase [Microbacterium sp.]
MTRLDGAHVLITGGSQGIGWAFARKAAASGSRVSLVARDATRLRSAAQAIGAHWRAADVTDTAALHAAIDRLEEDAGPCDILVCCAGFALPGRFLANPLDELDRQWEVNVRGAAAAAHRVLPGMVSRGRGHVVFTSSTAGVIGVVGYSGYAATKFAVRGFADSLRYEVEPAGVRVTVLFPPDTDTPGFAAENLRKPPETAAVSGGITPVSPEKVADALSRGIRRNAYTVTADAGTRALLRFGGALEPVLRRGFRRTIAKATDANG